VERSLSSAVHTCKCRICTSGRTTSCLFWYEAKLLL